MTSPRPAATARQRVSVVIRCHNYGHYLREATESVLAQTRPADEIVVVNDGSTDNSSEVLEQLASDGVKLTTIERRPARGAAASFNDGVRASSGQLIVALDADDRLSTDYLGRMEAAMSDPSVGFAYCGAVHFGASVGATEPPEWDADELMRENYVNVSAMFRREVFEATGGFRPELDHLGLEDWEFWVHAVEHGFSGRRVSGCHLEYRRHEGGSRDTLGRVDVLRTHIVVWRMHPRTLRARHVAQWIGRRVRRRLGHLRPSGIT